VSNDSSNSIERLRASLCELTGKSHCLLTGRGASAIYLALKALDRPPGKVLVPAVTCPTAIFPILYAGHEPVFCDINLEDYNANSAGLKRILEERTDVVAVLAIHSFGHLVDLENLARECRERGVFLIEDLCQALGATPGGKVPPGNWGDVSVLSFGYSKPVDAGDGGAVLTGDSRLAERIHEEALLLPEKPADFDELENRYRAAYYRAEDQARAKGTAPPSHLTLAKPFRAMHLFRAGHAFAGPAVKQIEELEARMQMRRQRANAYRELLAGLPLLLPVYNAGSNPWRFTFLVEDPALHRPLTEGLRARGFHASNWYPSLPARFGIGFEESVTRFSNARYFERRVINLWVDDTMTGETIEETARFIHDFIKNVKVK